ncbi:MAG: septal ring lytic transglycosylase RlpA family protein [Alphaproteobacteria bacterium]|nr:septal ring lytic transglycosylase RlpA family protein [Alphaproteobacteria bacterium]
MSKIIFLNSHRPSRGTLIIHAPKNNLMFLSPILSLLFTLLYLAGCSSTSSDRTRVTGVCKSCKPYFVRGSWHFPQEHYDYDEEGLASWYGPECHGKPKAYGEPFDQHALTAAHKTLPLPTIVRVTNLDNGRSVKVLVDDRGPYVYAGRIIDLSVASAKAIGTYNKGVARVRVTALVEESKAFSNYLAKLGTKSGRDPSGRTWLQVYNQEIDGNTFSDAATTLAADPSRQSTPIIYPPIDSILGQTPITYPAKKSAAPKPETTMDNLVQKLEIEKAPKPVQQKISSIFIDVGGQFTQEANAQKLSNEIRVLGKTKIMQTTHPQGQKFYSVRMGPFDTTQKAKAAVKDLTDAGQAKATIVQG